MDFAIRKLKAIHSHLVNIIGKYLFAAAKQAEMGKDSVCTSDQLSGQFDGIREQTAEQTTAGGSDWLTSLRHNHFLINSVCHWGLFWRNK